MWVLVLVILGAFSGVIGDPECENEVFFTSCVSKRGSPPPFPGTEEELQNSCSFFSGVMQCVRTAFEECGVENTEDMKFADFNVAALLNVKNSVCPTDSPLHSRLVENLGCFKELMESRIPRCNLSLHLQERSGSEIDLSNRDSPASKKYFCVFAVVETNCLAGQALKKCGSEAKDVLIETFGKVEFIKSNCPSDVRDEALELLDILEAETQEEILLRELI